MRNPTNKILAIAVILLLVTNLVMVYMMVKEKGRRGSKKEYRSSGPREMFKELNLSEDQKKAYEQLKEEHFKNSRPVMDSVRAAKMAYFNLVKDPSVNESTIRAFGDRVREKQAAADRMIFDHFRNLRQLFTAEQQVKFDSLLHKMMMQRGRRKDSTKTKSQ